MQQVISKRRTKETAGLQLVHPNNNSGRATSVVGLNQHVKKSVYRLVFESQLEITSLRQVARLAGLSGPRSEAKVLDAIRETVREATRPTPPSGPAVTAWPMRRAA